MPGLDRRGPLGEGPRTGRNLGHCKMEPKSEMPSQTEEGRNPDKNMGFAPFSQNFQCRRKRQGRRQNQGKT